MKKRVVKGTSKSVISKKTSNISARINNEARMNRMVHVKKVIPEKTKKINKRISNNLPAKVNNKVKAQRNIPAEKTEKISKFNINLKVLAVSFFAVIITAAIGSIFTQQSVNSSWYENIRPSWSPPNFVFPIVWGVLFVLIALSLYFSWTNSDRKERHEIAFVFAVNLLLNAVWSFLFFFLQNPLFAFFEIIPLWFSILLMIFAVYKINKLACYMLLPYFFWVSFAAALNYLAAFT